MTQMAPAAMRAGTLSAAGEELQRLPPRLARPCTWVEPMRLAASTTPGQALRRASCSPRTAPDVAAPMRKPPCSALISVMPGSFLMSMMSCGLCAPAAHLDQEVRAARQQAARRLAFRAFTASATLAGAR